MDSKLSAYVFFFGALFVGAAQAATDKPLSFCEKYALEAVSQSVTNRDAQCAQQGELWNTSYLSQRSWCEGVKKSRAEAAGLERSNAIGLCLAQRAVTKGVALPSDKSNNNVLMSFMLERYLKPVTDWYMGMEQVLLPQGRKLNASERALAEKIGVRDIQKVRIIKTNDMPYPDQLMGNMASLFKANAAKETGRAMGYALLVRPQYAHNQALLRHLLGYVVEIEKVGHKAFLERYATEILNDGYKNSALVKQAAAQVQ